MRTRRLVPLLLVLTTASAAGVFGSIVWTRTLGGNLQVLVAQYGAELFADPECTIVATSVSVNATPQGQVARSEVLYLKVTGGGRMFVYYDVKWLTPTTVQAGAEYSWDGATWQTWREGPLGFLDLGPGDVVMVRWTFTVPAVAEAGTYQYEITLRGENVVPGG